MFVQVYNDQINLGHFTVKLIKSCFPLKSAFGSTEITELLYYVG